MQSIAVVNQKGGVCKTTLTVNLAAARAAAGEQTLLIDTDPQASASDALGFNPFEESPISTLGDWYRNPEPLNAEKFLFETDIQNLYLLPNTLDSMDCESEIKNAGQPYGFLRKFINSKRIQSNFQNVFFDTPPHLDEHYKNAVMAAQYVLIPMVPDIKSIKGLVNLHKSLLQLSQDSNMRILGIVLTRVERTNINRDCIDWLRDKYGDLVFNTQIDKATVFQETDKENKISVMRHSPDSKSATQIVELSCEIEERISAIGAGRRKKPTLWSRSIGSAFTDLAAGHSDSPTNDRDEGSDLNV
jgi:chromosome partitioning protein